MVFVGVAVKLLDDFMDLRSDAQYGVPSIAVRLGEATLPYAMLSLALGAAFDPRFGLSLFLASYAVGMASDLRRILPLGLTGWQESLGAFLLGVLFTGPLVQLWALSMMAFVQCVDDLQDVRRDDLCGSANLVRRWGLGEVRLAALGFFMFAALLAPFHTVLLLIAVALIEHIVWRASLGRLGPGATVQQSRG